MKHQILMELGRELPPQNRTEPKLWIKTFAVYDGLSKDKLIRKIDLRKGLNIIWAKDSETGASGHAAGKSTFCRMLRYLLGDNTYGSDDFKQAFRDKFDHGYVAGEVYLNGKSWLLYRSLNIRGESRCFPGGKFDDLFKTKIKYKFNDYSEFTDKLKTHFIEPLAAQTFPGSGKAIEWRHILQWLTRDQDSRYSHMLEWRPNQLDPDAKLSAVDKTNLIRFVLGIIEEAELAQQERHNKLQSKKSDLDSLIPKLAFTCERDELYLRQQHKLQESDAELLYFNLSKDTDSKLLEIKKKWDLANSHDGVGEVLNSKYAELKNQTFQITETDRDLKKQLTQHRLKSQVLRGEITEEERKKQLSQMGDSEGKCSVLLEDAIAANCPLAAAPNRDELQAAKLKDTKTEASLIESLITNLESRIVVNDSMLSNAKHKEAEVAELIKSQQKKHSEARNIIQREYTEVNSSLNLINQASKNYKELQSSRAELKKIRSEIDRSNNLLKELRSKASKRLSELTDYYSTTASQLLNTTVNGDIQFNAENVVPSLDYSGDMSSAALVTLRLLTFDLACLIGSQHSLTNHPGFLIHDSPREADLSNYIYQRIFTLIAGEESTDTSELDAIQYIIATTEPPPEHLQKAPWLVCDPLSSEAAETRFLKAII